MKKIKFATVNEYKIKYANTLLNKHGWECEPFDVEMMEPQSLPQTEVSLFKVKQAYQKAGTPIITMDSGLFINSLGGFPGIYTSDIFKIFTRDHFQKLLQDVIDRSAYLQQTISFTDGVNFKTFTSKADGIIVYPEEMKDGHNFDALFKEESSGKLLGDLTIEEKGQVWGEDWDLLAKWLNKNFIDN